jgi:hypothetical protein
MHNVMRLRCLFKHNSLRTVRTLERTIFFDIRDYFGSLYLPQNRVTLKWSNLIDMFVDIHIFLASAS